MRMASAVPLAPLADRPPEHTARIGQVKAAAIAPDEPASASVLGASGRGIHWYARGDQLLGYVPGHDEGCYRVATGESMPALTSPWDVGPAQERTLTESLAADRVLSHKPAGSRSATKR